MRLLIIEDEIALCQELKAELVRRGFAVDSCHNGIDGAFMGESEPYDIIILDLGLPDKPGLEVLAQWRKNAITTPVLILTARGAWHEKVEGFRTGADDYLTKPFHIEELVVRLQALIRRASGHSGEALRIGCLRLNEDQQMAQWHEHERDHWRDIELTGVEFRLLRYLMLNAGKVMSATHLVEHVYDFNDEKESNVIEVYVSRLRKKLCRDAIRTRRGQGYYLDSSAFSEPDT
ncbi:response regulator transcription factor [Mariprofundus ferrooxydans]|nr:response regulator transcription factor [Mariprofundus ferrooxydans]